MLQQNRAKLLAESNDMTPVQGVVEVDIPIEVLWESFAHANDWSGWNKCFFWVGNRDLVQGQQLSGASSRYVGGICIKCQPLPRSSRLKSTVK